MGNSLFNCCLGKQNNKHKELYIQDLFPFFNENKSNIKNDFEVYKSNLKIDLSINHIDKYSDMNYRKNNITQPIDIPTSKLDIKII